MENLIKALQIFLKYGNPEYPTVCGHDVLVVLIQAKDVSEEDKFQLDKLGFFVADEDDEDSYFESFHYGSA